MNGAGRENRTLTLSLARTQATITSYPHLFGGAKETRTLKAAFTTRRISNPLQYHYGTAPQTWLPNVGSNHGPTD